MQALGSFWRTTGLSLLLTASTLAAACEESDGSSKTQSDVDEQAADAGEAGGEDSEDTQEQDEQDLPEEASSEDTEDTKDESTEHAADWCAVRNVLHDACTTCHNEQKLAGAPMSLMTYADLHKAAVSDEGKKVYELVKERVHDEERPMPPQQKLTDEQLAAIDAWVEAGAEAGDDPTCGQDEQAEAASTGTEALSFEWPDNCDATYRVTSHAESGDDDAFMIGAGEEIHPQVFVDAPWGEDDVQAIAWRPVTDNARVLHHWILYGANREFLVGWAPGKNGALMQEDVGMLLVGGRLRLDMHYNNLGNDQQEMDNSGVELCVVKKDNFRKNTATVAQTLGAISINVPPKATGVDVTSTCVFSGDEPVTLLSASPHGHRFAKHMKFTLERADGESIVMHDQSFDFEEQGQFELPEPLQVSKGDKIITTCTYDNDTDQTVTFGENTGNEMCFNFALYYPEGGLKCTYPSQQSDDKQ